MKATSIAPAAVLALVCMCGAADAQGQRTDYTARIAPGQRVEVQVISGSLKATRSEDADVHVEAVSNDPAVQVEVQETRGGVRICMMIDGVSCGSRQGQRSSRERDISLDVAVRVPDDVSFSGTMVSGNIDVEGLDAGINLTTVSGDATIALPAGTNAEFTANTISGRVESDFPLDASRRSFGPQAVRGTIGTGGQEVRAVTVSGNIRLRQQ